MPNSRTSDRVARPFAAAAVAAALVGAIVAPAPAGAAKVAFGRHGRVVTPFQGHGARGAGIARYGGGRLVVAGTASNGLNNDIALARYLPNGRLDPSFGDGGTVMTDLGGEEQGSDVAVDSQGRIVVAGYSGFQYTPAVDQPLVVRYLPDGSLDPSFGEGGVARPLRVNQGGALALAVDAQDRIVIVGGGTAPPFFESPWFAERLTASGQLDPSFGSGDGIEEGTLGTPSSSAEDVTIDSAGRILLAACGQAEGETNQADAFAVIRLLENGSPDPRFSEPDREPGTRRIDVGANTACPQAIATDRRNRIVVAGNGSPGWIAARLLPRNGALDRSFSRNGIVGLRFRNSSPLLGRIAIDGRNLVVLAGRIIPLDPRHASFPGRLELTRLRADGRLDRGFGIGGSRAFRFGSDKTFDAGASSLLIRGGAIYAAGTAAPHKPTSPPARFALLRYAP